MRRSVVSAMLGALLTLAAVAPATAIAGQSDVIHVDDDASIGGDGSSRVPYKNIADALAEAATTSRAVVIDVVPGDYPVSSPLVIDRPLDLRGRARWPRGGDGLLDRRGRAGHRDAAVRDAFARDPATDRPGPTRSNRGRRDQHSRLRPRGQAGRHHGAPQARPELLAQGQRLPRTGIPGNAIGCVVGRHPGTTSAVSGPVRC